MKNSTYCFWIQKFLELMTKDNWNDTMCDLTNFMATFTFPVGTDVVKIQSDLCKDLKEPTSLINKLLEEMNVKDIKKVRMSTCSNMYMWIVFGVKSEICGGACASTCIWIIYSIKFI